MGRCVRRALRPDDDLREHAGTAAGRLPSTGAPVLPVIPDHQALTCKTHPARRRFMFLRNTWYVAARSDEIGAALTPMTILGEKIVLYRRGDGAAVALEDACPHRKLPLSMGRREGDLVV